MSRGIGEWLALGRVGASSSALAAAALGAMPHHAPNYPHDSDDFGRCYILWGLAREDVERGLVTLAAISAQWKSLADNWSELCRLYETDRNACNDLVRKLVGRSSGMYEVRKGPDGRWDEFKVSK